MHQKYSRDITDNNKQWDKLYKLELRDNSRKNFKAHRDQIVLICHLTCFKYTL